MPACCAKCAVPGGQLLQVQQSLDHSGSLIFSYFVRGDHKDLGLKIGKDISRIFLSPHDKKSAVIAGLSDCDNCSILSHSMRGLSGANDVFNLFFGHAMLGDMIAIPGDPFEPHPFRLAHMLTSVKGLRAPSTVLKWRRDPVRNRQPIQTGGGSAEGDRCAD